MKPLLKFLAAAVCLSLAALLALLLRPSPPPPPRTLPSPNGYLDFLQAGQSVSGQPLSLKKPDPDEIRPHLEQNKTALAQVRAGLAKECAVPWIPTEAYLQAHTAELGPLKQAGLLLIFAATLDELDGNTTNALAGCLEAIQFAQLVAHDGLIVDRLVAEAIGRTSLARLKSLIPKLSPADRRRLLQAVLSWDTHDEPPTASVARERAFMNQAYSARVRLVFSFADLVTRLRGGSSVAQRNLDVLHQQIARRRLAITQLALAAFECEHQRPATRLEELCPDLLPSPLLDPFAAQPLIYKRTGDRWLLYSVGRNRLDDGGVAPNPGTSFAQPTGDLLADP